MKVLTPPPSNHLLMFSYQQQCMQRQVPQGAYQRSQGGSKPNKLADGVKPVTPMSVHLLAKKSCIDSAQMAKMTVPLTTKKIGMNVALRNELMVQIMLYFEHAGILNKEILSFMMESLDWPALKMYETYFQPLKSIMVPVTLLL